MGITIFNLASLAAPFPGTLGWIWWGTPSAGDLIILKSIAGTIWGV